MTEQLNGVPRALARRAFSDRLPPEVVNEQRRGFQAVDWHDGVQAARDDLSAEVERISSSPAAEILNTRKMQSLVENWPKGSWNSPQVVQDYRISLLRAVSNGHFVRKASGSNR